MKLAMHASPSMLSLSESSRPGVRPSLNGCSSSAAKAACWPRRADAWPLDRLLSEPLGPASEDPGGRKCSRLANDRERCRSSPPWMWLPLAAAEEQEEEEELAVEVAGRRAVAE